MGICRRQMSQEITVTKVEDHYEMQFDGGNAYPAPTRAIEKLDDEITPKEVGESITFRGDYGGAKHMKSFTVDEILDGLDDTEDDSEKTSSGEVRKNIAEPTPEHVAEVGYHTAAGEAQQLEAQRLFDGEKQ